MQNAVLIAIKSALTSVLAIVAVAAPVKAMSQPKTPATVCAEYKAEIDLLMREAAYEDAVAARLSDPTLKLVALTKRQTVVLYAQANLTLMTAEGCPAKMVGVLKFRQFLVPATKCVMAMSEKAEETNQLCDLKSW